MERRSLDSEALAHKAIDILSEHQAEDLALLDISKTSSFADFFVIATAGSPLQFTALVKELEIALKEEGHQRQTSEGSAKSGWALVDFGGVIVHIFTPTTRDYYKLEELWGKTTPVVRFTG